MKKQTEELDEIGILKKKSDRAMIISLGVGLLGAGIAIAGALRVPKPFSQKIDNMKVESGYTAYVDGMMDEYQGQLERGEITQEAYDGYISQFADDSQFEYYLKDSGQDALLEDYKGTVKDKNVATYATVVSGSAILVGAWMFMNAATNHYDKEVFAAEEEKKGKAQAKEDDAILRGMGDKKPVDLKKQTPEKNDDEKESE